MKKKRKKKQRMVGAYTVSRYNEIQRMIKKAREEQHAEYFPPKIKAVGKGL